MSDTITRLQYNKLFEFDKVSNSNVSPGVPPYVITSVTLRSLITKFLEDRKARKPQPEVINKAKAKRECSKAVVLQEKGIST
jgi:hypothetical protein